MKGAAAASAATTLSLHSPFACHQRQTQQSWSLSSTEIVSSWWGATCQLRLSPCFCGPGTNNQQISHAQTLRVVCLHDARLDGKVRRQRKQVGPTVAIQVSARGAHARMQSRTYNGNSVNQASGPINVSPRTAIRLGFSPRADTCEQRMAYDAHHTCRKQVIRALLSLIVRCSDLKSINTRLSHHPLCCVKHTFNATTTTTQVPLQQQPG